MQKPNFIIIGAPKSGTTSLYHYLWQHPDIEFSKVKEPKYFSFKDVSFNFTGHPKGVEKLKKSTINSEEDYIALFKNMESKYIGEASPNYFHFEPAAKNIFDFYPGMRLVVILRNPVERLYSDWKHNVRMGWEPVKKFTKILQITDSRMKNNGLPYYDYLNKGKYSTHLERYLRYFPKKHIKIIFYEDFEDDPGSICNEVIEFLGQDGNFQFKTDKIYMQDIHTPKNEHIWKMSKKIGRFSFRIKKFLDDLNSVPKEISPRDKAVVQRYYREEILQLEKLTGRSLRHWLE